MSPGSSKKPALGMDPFSRKVRSLKPEKTPENKPGEKKNETPHAIAENNFLEDSSAIKSILSELNSELEAFLQSPSDYKRDKIQSLTKAFLTEFREHSPSSLQVSFFDLIRKVRGLLRSDEVDEYGLDRKFELAIKPAFDFLYYKYFRVSVKGMENVPPKGRALLVANHSGVLPYDAAMIKLAIYNEHPREREVRFLVDDFVFHFPFLGIFMNRIGGVRACPENAERLLSQEELVSVFPEGIKGIAKPYAERYRLQRFGRGGTVRLALKTKSPIIPVAVVGAEEIHPLIYKSSVLARPLGLPFIPVTPTFPFLGPLGALPLPTKWTIVFGKPIPFDQYSAQEINDGILINHLNEKLRWTIQQMLYDELKERKSIFFG